MNTYASPSAASSAVPSISDLDGYTLQDYNFSNSNPYAPMDQDEFGFDPPEQRSGNSKNEQKYSSRHHDDPLSLNSWPGFEREEDTRDTLKKSNHGLNAADLQLHEIDKLISNHLPSSSTAVSRFGQVTPPRSNSTPSSLDNVKGTNFESPKTTGPERRKYNKTQTKDGATTSPPTKTTGRKRKTGRKAAVVASPSSPEDDGGPEDSKRKQSLEKNRLAAAKCRVNKKEKTEQLQRDSHDKAVHNALLKDQVMRMKEKVQQMNAILLSHANCDGCQSPEEIQKHLNQLGNEFFAQHMLSAHDYGQYAPLSMANQSPDNYFMASSNDQSDSSMINPPLPEFNRSAEFEVHTPMETD